MCQMMQQIYNLIIYLHSIDPYNIKNSGKQNKERKKYSHNNK